jgi:pimeloyl-ACP methyl ester carboxylesterase
MSGSALPRLVPEEEHVQIASPIAGLKLFLRYLPARRSGARRIVLYVHGGTFPSALSIAHRFDGRSWRDELSDAGFDVWGLDFHGFGGSDPYPEMAEPTDHLPALGGAETASRQIERAVRHIRERHGVDRVSIVAHSWGTIATGRFAGRCPDLVDRLVFFGPVTWRPRRTEPARYPAWRLVSLDDQWKRFVEDVPPGEPAVLSKRHFDEWGERYLDTDSASRTRRPPAVQTPSGPWQDIALAWAGELGYDPGQVRAPVCIIRGAWDSVVRDDDARWLLATLRSAPITRDVKIGRGTHLLHLEANRYQLYREAQCFLEAGDDARGQDGTAGHEKRGEIMADSAKAGTQIPGYALGSPEVAKSPISMDEWDTLKKSALFSEEDVFYLRLSHDVLVDQVDQLLAAWRGIIFDHPHLRAYDENPRTGEVDQAYAAAVKKRFGQWVLDTARAEYNQAWLDYQFEIGLRHHRTKKNQTDHGHTLGHIRARDLIAFTASIVVPMKPYLARKGHPAEIVSRMYDAWWKSVILQVTLWAQPYVKEGDF